jgi:hypothetical protein
MATPTQALTLFSAEDTLNCLAESIETVEPEQEQAFMADFAAVLLAAKEKRDGIAHVILRFDSEAEFTSSEIARLTARKQRFERGAERLRAYVQNVIEGLGVDDKGKFRRLEGNVSTLSLKKCPASVQIQDEALIPLDYKRCTVTLPAKLMERVLEALDLELHTEVEPYAQKASASIDKKAVKEAIDSKVEVAGASLKTDKTRLDIS